MLCNLILRVQPDHVEALHLTAVLALSAGRMQDGARLLRRVLALEFGNAGTFNTLGDVLTVRGERDAAVAAFRRGVLLWPDDPGLHVKLGVALCNLHRYEEAEAALRAAVALEPRLVSAHFNLAIVLARQSRHDEAVDAYRLVIALDPDCADAMLNLGNALMDQGRLEEAVATYRRALTSKPDFAGAHRNLALALHRGEHHEEALTAALKAVVLEPEQAEAHRVLGAVLRDLGRFDDAAAAYHYALMLRPDDATLHCGIGTVLHRHGRLEEAVAACRRASALAPGYAEAHKLMGLILHDLGRITEAVAAYRTALSLSPDDAAIASNLGAALCELGHFEEAIAACEQAIEQQPDYAQAHTNLGVVFEAQDRLEDACAAHHRAITVDPCYAKGYANLAIVLRDLGEIDDAAASARRAVEIDPQDQLARFNHALFLLMNGDYVEGFREYEWRRRCKALPPDEPVLTAPEWQGEPIAGRTLLLHAERGFGDSLQFVRFIPAIAGEGCTIMLQVQPPLLRLIQRSLPNVQVVGRGAPLPPFELHLPLMSLPRVLGTTLKTIPAEVPYLSPDPEKLADWRGRLGGSNTLKVGIVWAGNPRHRADRRRSLAAASILPRLVLPGVQLYSLQKEPRAADRDVLASVPIIDLAPALDDFDDTAAAIAALDLVVAVDTSVAHLAGALGRPTWVMLPYALDWRWLRDREDCPWYPTMRLFRQRRAGDWESVLARLPTELTRVAGGERDLLLPASPSVVWDAGAGLPLRADAPSTI
jgi:tetratricopeptide (TPR) repeat protein